MTLFDILLDISLDILLDIRLIFHSIFPSFIFSREVFYVVFYFLIRQEFFLVIFCKLLRCYFRRLDVAVSDGSTALLSTQCCHGSTTHFFCRSVKRAYFLCRLLFHFYFLATFQQRVDSLPRWTFCFNKSFLRRILIF